MELKNATIITLNEIIDQGSILIKEQRIQSITTTKSTNPQAIDCRGYRVFPGFIDMHTHGTDNADFMDKDINSIQTITDNLAKEGTTALLATTMTGSLDEITKALTVISEAETTGSKILGVHLEGPFINKAFKGAQNLKHIITGNPTIFECLQTASNNMIKLVTLAPEKQNESFLNYLLNQNIIISMGHSNASHDEVFKAKSIGIKRVTHCYNAMSKFHHRDIGLTGASLLYDDLTIELIADLTHVSAPALKLANKVKGNNIQLVTDAMRGKNMPDGTYNLGGQSINVKDNMPYTEDGTLAGSTLHFNDAAKNYQKTTSVDDLVLAKILSTNQAKMLKLDHHIGILKEGYYADMVVVDNDFKVMMTIINGEIYYRNEAF